MVIVVRDSVSARFHLAPANVISNLPIRVNNWIALEKHSA